MSADIEERLAAWLDGAMDADEAQAFEQELAANPGLAARAQDWKANDAFIAGALGPITDAPIDADMLARLGLAEPAAGAAAPLPAAANDNAPFWRRHALPLGGAIAASIAAVLMLAVPRGGNQAGDPLSLALDSAPSLNVVKLADGRTIQPTLTVRAADGRWCREFRSGDQTSLACRGEAGWKVEATTKATGPADPNEIGLAAGGETSGLDAAYQRLGASDPIDAGAENDLIARNWAKR
ncbi:MAG: anti-sigma factor family protein [Novosphingobium sp.]